MQNIPEIFKDLFDMSPGLVCLLDIEGEIKLINSAGASKLGYAVDELLNKNLIENFTVNSDKKGQWNSIKINRNENVSIKLLNKTGHITTWTVSNKKVFFQNLHFYLILGIDETDKIESQNEAKIADKLYDLNLNRLHKTLIDLQKAKKIAEETANIKQQFIANVSHEIRTPMNAIIGFSNILIKSNLGNQELEYVSAIKKSGDILMNIIDEILDLSKLESSNFIFDETDFDLKDIIPSLKTLFELRISDKNLEYDFEFDPNLSTKLIGDPGRLYQILVNLIGNSIKFTDRGFIKVKIEEVGRKNEIITLRFIVKDSGIGIDVKNLEKIFESFTQASNDTTRKYGGTGLGLTICKQMVELQGGKIYAKSKIGQGCSFIFELPYKLSYINEPVEVSKQNDFYFNKHQKLGKYKILIVEDNEINILLATTIIEGWGFQYSVATNGKKAIEKLKSEHFDLILMDIQMPEMDGYQATEVIRKSEESFNKIPIIATTAHATKGIADKAISLGINDYISKPFQLDILLQKMLKLLNNDDLLIKQNEHKTTLNNKLTNLEYLKRVAAGDKQFINKMIHLFIKQSTISISEIRQELLNNNWVNFRSKIHKLMPSISFMGITALSKELQKIEETKITPDNMENYAWLIEQLDLTLKQSCIELKQYLKGL